jgi:hypothetical protein
MHLFNLCEMMTTYPCKFDKLRSHVINLVSCSWELLSYNWLLVQGLSS